MRCWYWLPLGGLLVSAAAEDWKPTEGAKLTAWGKGLDPEGVWAEYPRAQLARPARGEERWLSLNGLWAYAIRPKGEGQPESWDGEILVPFAPGTALSGVSTAVGPKQCVWYQRAFAVPEEWSGERVLLQLETPAARVRINGSEPVVMGGQGFDLTDLLKAEGEQQLVVEIDGRGVGQGVWIEPVPAAYLVDVRPTADIDRGVVEIDIDAVLDGTVNLSVQVTDPKGRPRGAVSLGLSYEGAAAGIDHRVSTGVKLPLPNAELWSPDSPKLHGFRVELRRDSEVIDSVEGRFGMRKVVVEFEDDEALLHLNDSALFQVGPRYVGFWPDGGRTAPSEAALRHDLELTRELGFNMIRVVDGVAPQCLYQHCDQLGLLVWQKLEGERGQIKATVDQLRRHPCVVGWIPPADQASVAWLRRYDPTRPALGAGGDVSLGSEPGKLPPRRPGAARAVEISAAGRGEVIALEPLRAEGLAAAFLGPLTDRGEVTEAIQRADRGGLNTDRDSLQEALRELLQGD